MKKTFLIVFALIAIPIIIFCIKIINSPGKSLSDVQKNQALTQILGRKPILSDTTPKGNKTFKDKYASFSYPASAVIYNYRDPNIKKDQSALSIFSFDISNPRLVFNYSVIQYSSSTVSKVSDIPDVRLRQVESNSYTQNTAFADSKEGLVFQKQDQTGSIEKTAFFFVGGKAYSFSIQGSDLKGVNNLYNQIIDSTKFTTSP